MCDSVPVAWQPNVDDSVRVHRKLRVAGVRADLNVYEGLSHAEYARVTGSPEWRQVYGELQAFMDQHLAAAQAKASAAAP